jgi:hypothetical protein
MYPEGSGELEDGEDYSAWLRRRRLELLAFDARLAGVPPALLEALWEACSTHTGAPQQGARGVLPWDYGCGLAARWRDQVPLDADAPPVETSGRSAV